MAAIDKQDIPPSPGQAPGEMHIRPARRDDAEHLARLINIAGEGIPRWSWGEAAATPEQWLEVGTQRASREEGCFSWRNAWVVEQDNEVAAMLLGYAQPDPYPTEELASMSPVVQPLVELEAMAPGSWYVNALAAYPAFRGQGLGSRLLAVAEGMARLGSSPSLSIIVAEQNHGAVAVYERCGYVRVDQRPITPFPECEYTGDWLLLVKPLKRQQDVLPGLYRHYKGKEYRVMEVATHSETREQLVVYRALYGDFGMWVRPLAMFCEDVEIDGRIMKRFQRIGD